MDGYFKLMMDWHSVVITKHQSIAILRFKPIAHRTMGTGLTGEQGSDHKHYCSSSNGVNVLTVDLTSVQMISSRYITKMEIMVIQA